MRWEEGIMDVVGISGSLRSGSYNTLALRLALRFAAESGAREREISLKELDLPIYNEDLPVPPAVPQLKETLRHSDLIVIASPEYNYSIPGGLKNAIDWVSRGGNPFDRKVVAILGASNGPFGTIRLQPHLRQVMEALNAFLLPQPQVMIRNAAEAFAPDGTLADKKLEGQLRQLIDRSLRYAQALKDF
jgi:chromate reductase